MQITMEWAKYLGKRLIEASWQSIEALKDVLPAETALKLLEAVSVLLRHESTVVDVRQCSQPAPVAIDHRLHQSIIQMKHSLCAGPS